MSFLTIPHQDSIMIRKMARGRTALGGDSNNNDDEEEEEDEEGGEDDEEDVRLIPRCSPVPRKRGASIFDETAEYMRIQRALPAGKRVAFADTTGGDLVDVHEFVAFDSDDESEIAKWEEEEAKYRKPELEPTYEVRPEFSAPDGSALLRAVRSGKVEVERMSPVEGEPLAFSGIIRVLNISFDKAVYIRSTMDGWGTYFDYPAEYVPGSNDGDTDQFSFKLSFAPPYITHGSRIEFVIRYETSHGDFWANNSSMNYAVTLLLSYEDEALLKKAFVPHARSILKPPKVYSMDDDHLLSDDEQEKEEEESRTSNPVLARPIPVCPVIVQEEIDVETAVHPSGSPATPSHESPSVDGTLSAHTVFPSEQFPCTSSETTLLTNSGPVLCASESVQPTKSEPPPSFHCDLHNHVTEQPVHCSASAPLPAAAPCPSPPQSTERSDASPPEEEQSVASEGSGPWDPASEINLLSATTEDAATHLEPPAECASSPTGTLEQTAAGGLSELEGSTSSTEHCGGSTPSPVSPVAETQASLGGESEAPSSPELTSVNTDSTKVAHCGGSKPSPVSPVAETQAALGGESESPSSPELTSVNTDSTKVAHCGGSTPSPVSPVAETWASLGGESESPSSPELTSVNTDSTKVAHCGGSTPSPVSPVAETQASLGGESEAPSSPELTSVNTDSTMVAHCGGSTPSPVSPVAETQASLGGESEAPSSPELTSVNTDSTMVAHCGGSTPSPVSPVAETWASLGGESESPSSPELTSVNTDSTKVAHCGGSTPSPVSPVAETQASLGGESEAPSSPELTSVNTDSTMVAHCGGSTPSPVSPVAETQASLGGESEAPSSPELTSVNTDSTKVSHNVDPSPSVSALDVREHASCISPGTSVESAPSTPSEVSEPQSELDASANLMPGVYFLSGVVSLSIMMQEPSTLFLIGLLMVLRRL